MKTTTIVVGLMASILVSAQTRTAEIEAARDKKSAELAPETVSKTENVMLYIKDQKIIERFSTGYNGLRLKLGAMATNSGFAFGPEFYREDLLHGQLRVDGSAQMSTRLWQKYQVGFTLPHLANDKFLVNVHAIRRDYRGLEFYGLGPDSGKGSRSDYRLMDTSLVGSAAVQPVKFLRFGGTLGGLWTHVGPGKNEEHIDTGVLFGDQDAPGLDAHPNFVRYGVFGQVDYRDNPAGPKSGGNYVTQYTFYNDPDAGEYDFRRLDIDIQQYVPFFNKTRRLALRGRMTFTDPSAGNGRIPFYLQPNLGGSDDLRGFRPYRFTDRNAVVYNAEYRWEIFSGLDGAAFFDAGKVMPRRTLLNFSNLETSAGFGFRFNARNRTFIRLDVGFSHEGMGVWLKFNDPFLPRLFGANTEQPLY